MEMEATVSGEHFILPRMSNTSETFLPKLSPTNTATTADTSTIISPSSFSINGILQKSPVEQNSPHFIFTDLPSSRSIGTNSSDTQIESPTTTTTLDFNLRDEFGFRPSRISGGEAIPVSKQSRPTPEIRFKMMLYAIKLGWNDATNRSNKEKIAKQAIKIVSYDCGLNHAVGATMMKKWMSDLDQAVAGELDFGPNFLGNQSNFGKQQYHIKIESMAPGFIHKIYRKAEKEYGREESFTEMAFHMNELSRLDDDGPNLEFTKFTLRKWFDSNGGRCKKLVTKPLLTALHKDRRVTWCRERLLQLQQQSGQQKPVYFAFLDEKWFYPYSGRKQVKELPAAEHEDPNDINSTTRRESSRRHVSKVMFLGVVGCPVPERGFDGKIFLKRVARTTIFKQTTYKENDFSDDVALSTHVKHNWRFVCADTMTACEATSAVADHYGLLNAIRERLVLRYKSLNKKGNYGWVCLEPAKLIQSATINVRDSVDHKVKTIPLVLDDLVLQVRWKKGEEHEDDINCNSEFMKEAIGELGPALRKAYHWVELHDPIHLIMDNAGGHGTNDCIDEYVSKLQTDFNIAVVWQVPRSPETNLLDLGIWRSLQSFIERAHRGKRSSPNALAKTARQVWKEDFGGEVFSKVYERWQKVLQIIVDGDGENVNTDAMRGKKYENLFAPPILPGDELSSGSDTDTDVPDET